MLVLRTIYGYLAFVLSLKTSNQRSIKTENNIYILMYIRYATDQDESESGFFVLSVCYSRAVAHLSVLHFANINKRNSKVKTSFCRMITSVLLILYCENFIIYI